MLTKIHFNDEQLKIVKESVVLALVTKFCEECANWYEEFQEVYCFYDAFYYEMVDLSGLADVWEVYTVLKDKPLIDVLLRMWKESSGTIEYIFSRINGQWAGFNCDSWPEGAAFITLVVLENFLGALDSGPDTTIMPSSLLSDEEKVMVEKGRESLL